MSSSQWLCLILPWLLLAGAVALVAANRRRMGWQLSTYLLVTLGLAALGATLAVPTADAPDFPSIPFTAGAFILALAAIGVILGAVEFALMPLLGQFRLGAISRVTYYEALLQPFTIIMLFTGIAAIGIVARLPFFTYDEDFKMYRDVAASFVFLFTLPVMIFASTKTIDEEIENRTMLTLMSKPVARWQVILGKYLGVFVLVLVGVLALGVVTAVCQYLRYYDDQMMDYRLTPRFNPNGTIARDFAILEMNNLKAFYALLPGLALTLMQLATLAAISVAVSTRYGLAANVTAVVIIYVAASMAQYFRATQDLPQPFQFIATMLSYLLPGLGLLDLNQRLVFGVYEYGRNDITLSAAASGLPTYRQVWQYVGIAALYSVFYIGAALSMGMALFRSRELS